ncbi:GNAT family N-acetyltransferase [Pseudoruegeria sp. HB172150]|uniref:GNAT family N-acetyltransferase n=1 Tax=Pseudoruegeria sp. HB172150 TaxID=2721164 RepID=UPI001554B0C2|nr:GNAT family N-acetyltransferase [Pseudoruegeria sp. HB172150]
MTAIRIRPLTVEDAPHVARIYFCAIHEGSRGHYDYSQRLAWGGLTVDPAVWRRRLKGVDGFVAERDCEPLGFMTLDDAGYIDLAFVLPSAAGHGIGRRLYEAVEARARKQGLCELTVQASKVARPLFEKMGWVTVAEQQVTRQDVKLTNYRMRKPL